VPFPLLRLDSSLPDAGWNCAVSLPRFQLVATECGADLFNDARIERSWSDPLDALHWMAQESFASVGPGRWIGYLGYDLGRRFERLPSVAADDLHLPDFAFGFRPVNAPAPTAAVHAVAGTGRLVRSTFSRDAYERAVSHAVEYIRAGDVFQVNLSQRYEVACPLPATEIYRRLLAGGGVAYGAILDFGSFAVVSHSPELFLKVDCDPATGRRRVITRPIKGTRPLLPGMEEELRRSIKDQAELNMIIDLERNDLGRVCEIGSVIVSQPRTIEEHPTLYHGVATVEGLLRPEIAFVDLLRATFPGGSITGAPKIRAMEIIEELEAVRRGPYCGAIGYISSDGSMQFNVAIRTMTVKDGVACVPVGGGIVADSDPAAEYEETLVKAKAMFAALGV
jgi:para-aminobenzoate synthetase component 1